MGTLYTTLKREAQQASLPAAAEAAKAAKLQTQLSAAQARSDDRLTSRVGVLCAPHSPTGKSRSSMLLQAEVETLRRAVEQGHGYMRAQVRPCGQHTPCACAEVCRARGLPTARCCLGSRAQTEAAAAHAEALGQLLALQEKHAKFAQESRREAHAAQEKIRVLQQQLQESWQARHNKHRQHGRQPS